MALILHSHRKPFISLKMDKGKATGFGLLAIVLWSSNVGLIRYVSESFGAVGGAALIYTLASLLLLMSIGFSNIRKFPKPYLIWGTLLFVSYEICFALAIGLAKTPRQAIEVGMVNYLWPTFTIIASILFNQQKSNALMVPGVILSFSGIVWVLGGEQGINVTDILHNIQMSPLSYGMALMGAVIWAAYCVVTARMAKGSNGITFYFMLVAMALWGQYFMMGEGQFDFNMLSMIALILIACAMGFGYAAWNIGILHGNVTLLATVSYFIPIFSALMAALILQTPLSLSFWQGVMMVCGGSILCWLSTRRSQC